MIRNSFRSFKGRTIQQGQKVKVYKNLTNGLWSIKDSKSGLVLGHAPSVSLVNAKFSVGEKGRLRVIEEKKKYVHAYIIGEYMGTTTDSELMKFSYIDVTYNPFKDTHFTLKSDRTIKLTKASEVLLNENSVFANAHVRV